MTREELNTVSCLIPYITVFTSQMERFLICIEFSHELKVVTGLTNTDYDNRNWQFGGADNLSYGRFLVIDGSISQNEQNRVFHIVLLLFGLNRI